MKLIKKKKKKYINKSLIFDTNADFNINKDIKKRLKDYKKNKYCCLNNKLGQQVLYEAHNIISMINLNNYQKRIIIDRYCNFLDKLSEELNSVQFIIYHFMKIFIPLLTYIIPSLYTISHFLKNNEALILFWVLWGLMVIHSIMSGFIKIFDLDKKYSLNLYLVQRMEIEIWEFLSQILDYEINENNIEEYCNTNTPSHQILFQKFAESIGKIIRIKMKSNVHFSKDTKYSKMNTKRFSKTYYGNNGGSTLNNGINKNMFNINTPKFN